MPNPSEQDVELLAELVGSTNAELKQVDEMIVSSSANLRQSNDQWNPQKILKDHIQTSAAPGTLPPTSPSVAASPTPPPAPVPSGPPPAGVHPGYAQPQQQVMHVVTREFEDRLEVLEKKVDKILSVLQTQEKLDQKISNFVDRGLKNRVKQITLKLDDLKE